MKTQTWLLSATLRRGTKKNCNVYLAERRRVACFKVDINLEKLDRVAVIKSTCFCDPLTWA